jgi:hypothetical protein
MTKLASTLALAACTLACAGAAYGRQASTNPIVPSVTINTATGQTLMTLKTSELSVVPEQTVTVPVKGVPTVEKGPSLQALLTFAGVSYNAACRNDELRWWIEVSSSTGAAVVLTAGEIDPLFGNRPAILSINEGGQFLTDSGPKLIVPNDSGQRNIPKVSVITVGRAPAQLASTTPACSPTVALSSAPPAGSIQVNGAVSAPATFSYSQLQAMPQASQTVSFLNGATPVSNTESGPTLASVVAAAKPKYLACDPTDRLRFYAAVTSSIDGYTALVSFPEFDPSLNNVQQLLSLVENGSSLATVGPRNTVPGDVRGGRYVSGGAVVTVFRAPTEVPIPSCRKKT